MIAENLRKDSELADHDARFPNRRLAESKVNGNENEQASAHVGYDPTWFDALSQAEDRHFWFRTRNQIIADVVGQIVMPLAPDLRVLEAGCGNGNVLRVLESVCPDGQIVGLDLFQEGLDHARRRCECTLVRGDVRELPFSEGSFDLIGMFDVLEHLPEDQQVLNTLHSLLSPGGALVLTVPACPALWSYFDEVGGHCRRYQAPDLIGKLGQAGFKVVYVTHFMMTIFPLVWAARRWAGRRHTSGVTKCGDRLSQARAELRIRPIVNELLLRLLRWESWWIARRRRSPIGTSLLAVGQKSSA